ncbi:MAG: SLC13 family permease [Spirochaetes bacterium]|jgi:di/tricarboxylate transporter|nr:SLC13 family permease [Spirochaetota bacterium]
MIYTTIVIAALLLLLIFDVASSDTVFGAALILLLFGGIISPEEALAGFSNKGMVTVGLLFIVSQGVENTGIFQNIAGRFLHDTHDGEGSTRSIARLMMTMMAPVTVLSSFLNNTPIVTIFTPVVKRWTSAQGLPAGKFLIPLSYAAIFGGACTLIGTSTNLVVHGMMLQHGEQGFAFFELAKVGVPVAVAGYLYLALLGPRLLPDTRDPFTKMGEAPKEYFIEMTVPADSPLIGKTIEQAGMRNMHGVYLTDIERGDLHLGPVTPDRRIAAGDRLFFAGRTDSIADVVAMNGLKPVDEETFYRDTRDMRRHLVEVVVSENSPAVGHTIRDYGFRSVYNAAVVAVSRGGERVNTRLGDVRIRPGDTMVLLTKPNFVRRYRFSRDFYLVSGLTEIAPRARRRGPFAAATVVGMILLAAFGGLLPEIGGHRIDMFYAAAAAALILVGGKTIGATAAREAIRWDVLITIGAAFGVSRAMVNSGVAPLVGQGLVDLMAPFGALGAIAAVYVVTSVFTAIITNNAAAAIMFPIALSTSQSLGSAGLPFFVAVAMGASASFATPIGYQTNLIVQGAGGYRFRDFVKVGLPMNALAAVVGIVAIALWYVL